MSAFSFPWITTNVTPHSPKREATLQKQPANASNRQKRMPLIIKELSAKTHETTGNKPAKLEMINKTNMIRNNQTAESNTSPTVTAHPYQQMHTTCENEYH
jgi:hypothetical protein